MDQLDGPAGLTSWTDQFSIPKALASLHIRRFAFQFVHCRSFRVRRRPCFIEVHRHGPAHGVCVHILANIQYILHNEYCKACTTYFISWMQSILYAAKYTVYQVQHSVYPAGHAECLAWLTVYPREPSVYQAQHCVYRAQGILYPAPQHKILYILN